MASTSSTFQQMILLRLCPEYQEHSFIMDNQLYNLLTTVLHPVGFLILVCLLLLMHTSLKSERKILVHERRQFKGDSSLMDTQPYVGIEFGRYQRSFAHPSSYKITAAFLLVPVTTILETAHDRLAHRGLYDFGMPSIAHAYEFDIRV
ncbi:hypothetical protein T12_7007 [Trichinella patagoniensis]|uniref:Uncharacterized protein n=1 Tax=Trichinella patagoniensis TaxID=990121 RepID=A0A0V0YYV4_9BILA|nr:hypothetical protein T12_7007 [Trichinella patagoniensis]